MRALARDRGGRCSANSSVATPLICGVCARTREERAGVKQTPEYQQLDEEAKASLDKVKGDVADKDKRVGAIQAKLDAVTDPFQNQRGRIVVITFKLETSPRAVSGRAISKRQLDSKKKEQVTLRCRTITEADPAENGF